MKNAKWIVLWFVLWFALPRAQAESATYYDNGDVQLSGGGSVILTQGRCPVRAYFNEGYEYAYKAGNGDYVGCYVIEEKVRGYDAKLYLRNWNTDKTYVYNKDEFYRPQPTPTQINVPVLGGYQSNRVTTTCVTTHTGVVSCF